MTFNSLKFYSYIIKKLHNIELLVIVIKSRDPVPVLQTYSLIEVDLWTLVKCNFINTDEPPTKLQFSEY